MKGATNNKNPTNKSSRYGNQNTARGVKPYDRNPRSKEPPKPKEPHKPKSKEPLRPKEDPKSKEPPKENEQAKKLPPPERKTSRGPVAAAIIAKAKVVLLLC